MRTLEDVYKLLKSSFFWECQEGGFMAHEARGLSWVSDAELASVDPRLPVYIRLVADTNQANSNTLGVDGDNVAYTLHYWTTAPVILTDTKGVKHILKDIGSMHEQESRGVVIVYGDTYVIGYVSGLVSEVQTEIPYVLDCSLLNIKVYKEKMDETYPNWEKRWNTAESLGMPEEERPSYILGFAGKTAQSLPVNMSQVGFD